MNILFLFVGVSHLSENNGMYNQLINEFHKHGHKVVLATRANNNEKTGVYVENGIDVLRIKNRQFTGVSNKVKKALAYQQFVLKNLYYIKRYFKDRNFDLIFSHSLPPEVGFLIKRLKRVFKAKSYLLYTDYTWQAAVALGFFSRKGVIASYYRHLDRMMLSIADYISCPTKGNISFILKEYPHLEKKIFQHLYFWGNTQPVNRSKEIFSKFNIENKFTVIYGGRVGPAQKLENLLDLAKTVSTYEDIVFLLLSQGPHFQKLKEKAKEENIDNILFLDFIPQVQYLQLQANCDVGLIFLNENNQTPNFPSKTVSLFNSELPILASIDKITDFGKFLEETNTGLWSLSGDTEAIKNNLLTLYHSPELRDRIKENQRVFYKNNMTSSVAYNRIISLLSKES